MTKFMTGGAARAVAVAAGTAAVMAVGAGAASATTVLAGGVTAPSGSVINASLVNPPGAVLVTPNGNVTCTTGNLQGSIGTNSTASGSPVTGAGSQFNLGSCTDTIGGAAIVVNSASLAPGTTPALSILGGTGGGTVNITSPQVRVSLTWSGLPASCTLTVNNATTTAPAALGNSNSSITFSSVPAVTSTSGVCSFFNPTAGVPASTNFSATFRPATIGSAAATVNP